MTVSVMSGIGSLPTLETREGPDWQNTAEREQSLRIRDAIRSHCRDQLEACVSDSSSAMTQQDVEAWMSAMEERLLRAETEDEKTQMVREMGGQHAQEFIRQTRMAGNIIDRAERNKWILPSTAAEWRAKMKRGTWQEKKAFITGTDEASNAHTLRAFYRNWKEISILYKDVLGREKALGITKEDRQKYPQLADFHHPDMTSGKLKYLERRWRVEKALAFLKTFKAGAKVESAQTKTELASRARSEIMNAVHAKAVDETKAMRWLEERVLVKPTKQLEKYIAVDLRSYVQNCIHTRVDFDHVESKMSKNPPQGFNRITPAKFLTLTLNQRRSYVEQAKQRLHLAEAPSPREMENLKLGIRHALDTKDWEEAEELLTQARKLLEHGKASERDRFELDSMQRYVKEFRAKEQKDQQPLQSARETLEQMRAAFAQIPSSLKPLYLAAMSDPDKLDAVAACTYNRVWCREHGHLTDNREKELEQQSTTETQTLAASGAPRKKGLDNVKLGVVVDRQHEPAVRRYDQGEWAPTVIHMPPNTHANFLSLLETRKNNHAFRYWTTLIPTDVTYEEQLHLVRSINKVLKRGARTLKEHGLMFTESGPPPSLN